MRKTAQLAYLFLMLVPIANTSAQAESQFSLSPSLLRFDYTEFGTSGNVLDSETGWIPGIDFQFDKSINDSWSLGIQLSLYDGNVDYDGQTQAGQPATTTTDTTLIRFGITSELALSPLSGLIFGVVNHEWQRSIRDTTNAFGLYEEYSWWEIYAGITSEVWRKENQSAHIDIILLKTADPALYVDLSRFNYGEATLDLGDDWGTRFRLSWAKEQAPDRQYGFNIFYEAWDFGRSNTKATSGSAGSLFITEPRSETRHSGVQFTVDYKY